MNGRMIRTYGSNGRENLTRLAVSAALLTLTACGGGGGSSSVDGSSLDGSNVADNSVADSSSLDLSNLQEAPPSIGAATDGSISAATDTAETSAGQVITVAVLNNDIYPEGTQLQLIGQPANGTATMLDSGEVEYIANADFEGTDTVEYVLVSADGTTSTGTLYIAVACEDCSVTPLAPAPAPVAPLAAVDESGNPFCVSGDADPDGDGYGWEDETSCVVRPPVVAAAKSSPLVATSDFVTLDAGTTTAVSALSNDTIANPATVDFSIDVQPTVGTIEAADSGVVVYTAPENYGGTDSVVYSLTDDEGNTSMASIEFDIACAWCATLEGLRLSWPANPANENVESYRVFFGPDENIHTSTQLTEVRASDFDGSAPHAVYDFANDLNISGTEGGCFRVTAVRGAEESEPSEAICFDLG